MSGLQNFFNSIKQSSKIRTFWALSAIALSLVALIYFTVLKMDIFNMLSSNQTSIVINSVLDKIFIIVLVVISVTFIFYTIKMFKPQKKK